LRVLHTSDLHLKEKDPRTVDTLQHILDVAKEKRVDIVTIAGDMFDSPEDANGLRPDLREMLTGNGFTILVLPGNHDSSALTEDTFYGNDVTLLTNDPVTVHVRDDVLIAAVPFKEKLDDDTAMAIAQAGNVDKTKILLMHCTLDIGFDANAFGEEVHRQYMPVSSAMLAGLGYDYVLAGHFHIRAYELPLANGGMFVYPGSPMSHTWRETGPRYAYLLDTQRNTGEFVRLSTFYYDELYVEVYPGTEDKAISRIRRWAKNHLGDNCDGTITVTGFTERSETELNDSIEQAAGGIPVNFKVLGIGNISQYAIYRRFKQKLESDPDIEDKVAVDSMVLRVISRLVDGGELSL